MESFHTNNTQSASARTSVAHKQTGINFIAVKRLYFAGSEYYAYCNSDIDPSDDRCQFAAAAIMNDTRIVIDVPENVILDGIDGGDEIIGPVSRQY